MWSKKPTPVATSARPVPSRSSSTRTFDSLVSRARSRARSRLIVDSIRRTRRARSVRPGTLPSPPAVPTETRSQPSGPVSRISTPRSSSALPDGVPVGEACRTARSWRRCRRPARPLLAQPGDRCRRARRAASSTVPSSSAACRSAASAAAWVTAREVVRQPDDAERVADLRGGREVAEPGAGERERLAHRAGDDQVAVPRQQLERAGGAGAAELGVRLVDDHDARRPPPRSSAVDRLERQRGAGRVVRATAAARRRPVLDDQRRARASRSSAKSVSRWPDDPAGDRVAGVLGIHRVRRREAERRPARAAEGLQQLQHHLVGAVGRPDLLGRRRRGPR